MSNRQPFHSQGSASSSSNPMRPGRPSNHPTHGEDVDQVSPRLLCRNTGRPSQAHLVRWAPSQFFRSLDEELARASAQSPFPRSSPTQDAHPLGPREGVPRTLPDLLAELVLKHSQLTAATATAAAAATESASSDAADKEIVRLRRELASVHAQQQVWQEILAQSDEVLAELTDRGEARQARKRAREPEPALGMPDIDCALRMLGVFARSSVAQASSTST